MNKAERHRKILRLVKSGPILSQIELRRRLRAVKVDVTQATLSRDLHELSLVKTSAGYKLPESLKAVAGNAHQLRQTLSQLTTEVAAANHLVVVKTNPGNAAAVALSLDHSGWKDVVGTVAGDDTILVVTKNASAARGVRRRIMELTAT